MSKTVLMNTQGFTPVIDGVLRDTSASTALVFGMVWRFCQMDKGVCLASKNAIAKRLGVSVRHVMRHINILVDKGYIEDLTPAQRNHPHIYRDTGKAEYRPQVEPTNDGELVDEDNPHTAYGHVIMKSRIEDAIGNLDEYHELDYELNGAIQDKMDYYQTHSYRTSKDAKVAEEAFDKR
jgi:DNA-binding transcriptional MocR family regulator